MVRSTRSRTHDLSLAVVLSTFLATVYLLSFCGQFRSIDEFAGFAQTESYAQGNGQNTPLLAFTPYHNPVGKMEPGQPLLAVPLYLIAQQIPGASNIAAVMLFNVFITALTGGMLYLLLRRFSFSQLISVGTVLAWGIGTMAWPYARSFFREPLNGLVWVTAATLCVAFSQTSKILYALGCIAVLCVGLVTKSPSAAAVPVFLLTFLWDSNTHRFTLGWKRVILLVVASLVTFGVGMQLHNTGLTRTLPTLADYTVNYPFKDALLRAYGAFFSPVKGLIFYSPIILATVVGWPRLVKRHGLAAFLILGVTFSLLYLYGGNGAITNTIAWHGGSVVWGPRYHLPLLPLLLLPYAAALSLRSIVAKIWVGVWSLAGLIIQLAVATASWSAAVWQMAPAYTKETLIGLNGIPWYSWKLLPRSPALVQLLHWQPRQLDLIWLRALADGTLAGDKYLALLLLTLSGLAFLALLLIVVRRRVAIRYARVIAVGCVLLVLAGSTGLLLRSGRDTNDNGLTRNDARQMVQVINSSGQIPYSVAFVSNDFYSNYWLGLLKGQFVTQWYSPYDKYGPFTIVKKAPNARTIWLVIDRAHMPPDAKPYLAREMLAKQAYEVSGQWVGDFELFEYVPPAPMVKIPVQRSWVVGIQITALAINTRQPHPGDVLRLDMGFSTLAPLGQNYSLFVHLVPAQGAVIAGRDGEPQYGGAPTSAWKPKKTVLDQRGIRVPLDAKPGVYLVVCGWLDPDGTRLRPTEGEGMTFDEGIVLGTVEVLAD